MNWVLDVGDFFAQRLWALCTLSTGARHLCGVVALIPYLGRSCIGWMVWLVW